MMCVFICHSLIQWIFRQGVLPEYNLVSTLALYILFHGKVLAHCIHYTDRIFPLDSMAILNILHTVERTEK